MNSLILISMKTRLIAFYSLFLGIAVLGMWGAILASSALPEGPVELTFHLISETLMALAALASGILMLRGRRYGKMTGVVAHGMVIYSVLNAAGYYAERGERLLPALFILLMLGSAWSIFVLGTSSKTS